MNKPPVIPYTRTLDDCIRGLNNIRAYFNEPVTPTVTQKSTPATVASNTVITFDPELTDIGGTGKKGKIQIRFMGIGSDGSDSWQLEVVTVQTL